MRLRNHLLLGIASLAALGAATTTTEATSTEAESTSTSSQSSTSTDVSTSTDDSSSTQSSETDTTSTSITGSTSATGSTSVEEPTTTTTLTTTSVTTVTVTPSITTTSTASTATSTGDSSTRTDVVGDLTAINAQPTTVAGQPGFVMNATPGSGSSVVGTVQAPSGAQPGDSVKVTAEIIVTSRSEQDKRQIVSDNTSCDLIIALDREVVYNRTLVLTGGVGQRIESDEVPVKESARLDITQRCRAGREATLVIYNIALELVRGTSTSTASETTGTVSTITTTVTDSITDSSITKTTATTSLPSTTGFPEFSNRFRFLGCVESSENYPTFFKAAEEADMTIGRCTEVCRGFDYAGVHTTGCYCGRALDGTRTRVVPAKECNLPCPGNPAEFCGGNLLLERGLSRRQAQPVPNFILLTVYAAISIIPPPVTTATATVTGRPHPSHVVCHDGRCDPVVIILKPYPGEDCRGEIVYEKIICEHCDYEHNWEPFRCEGNRCDGKVVYKPEECTRGCDKEIIVIERHCDKCIGGVIYKDQVIVIPPVTIDRNHTRSHTITRHKTHSRSHTVTRHHTRSKEHTVTLTESPATITTTVTPTISLTTSVSVSSTSPSDSPSPSTSSPISESAPASSASPTSTRGDPRERIIDDPTETTEATATETSPAVTETSPVIVSGGDRTIASLLSAVIGLVLFL